MLAFKEVHIINDNNARALGNLACKWENPPKEVCKINWDAVVDKLHCKVGIEIIARDCERKIMATKRMQSDLFPNPLLAESFGAFQATIFGAKIRLKNIILEGDALQVVQSLTKIEVPWNSTGLIITDIKQKMLHFDW